MFSFKGDTLTITKVETPKLNTNVMLDLQHSYRKYLEETVYEDFEYLSELISSIVGFGEYELVIKVKPLNIYSFMERQTRHGNKFFPVTGYFTRNGAKVTDEWELLHIPYMNDYGKLNVEGSEKVIISVQRSAEDISYNISSNTFNIAMPKANLKIESSKKGIRVNFNRHKYPIEDLIMSMLYVAGDDTRLSDIFKNTMLLNNMSIDDDIIYEGVYNTFRYRTNKNAYDSESDLVSKLASPQYKLGNTRNALNENLSLRRAVGQVLSRQVLSYPRGTIVTEAMVSEFIRNRINCIYVINNIIPTGYVYAGDQSSNIVFDHFPKGMHNGEFLKTLYPQYADYSELPVDIVLEDPSDFIWIMPGDHLTEPVIELLIDSGRTALNVRAENSQRILTFSFEREIVGNYTAKLSELVGGKIPQGRSADEWVYYYNNVNLDPVENDHLNAHDIIAITSTIGEILLTHKTSLLDRDHMFLKKVLFVNEIFSETLRSTFNKYIYAGNNKNMIISAITSGNGNNPFQYLTKTWISHMISERFLASTDTINLAAEVSQVNHVNTDVKAGSEVTDAQRYLAMPYYGRICPYETPAGKKLGIVNTKAIGARVENGLLLTPYRKVLSTNTGGIRVSDNITWLSVKDELGYRFGDILSLVKDESGQYINNTILARIPNPVISDEPFIFKNIKAYDLAGGYVNAVPEQFLSPTACLIPFAASDDPVRISYGLSQIKQSIYLVNSEQPLVRTPMHEDIFSYSEGIHYTAPCAGTVTSINNLEAHVRDNEGKDHIVKMQGSLYSGGEDSVMEITANVGDVVEEGYLLGVSHTYPQPFVLRAPYDCYIESLSSDGITISKKKPTGGFINLEDGMDTIKFQPSRINGQSVVFANIKVSVGDFLHKGDIIADTLVSRGGIYTPSRNALVAYNCAGYNYEDGICATERASINYISIISHKLKKMASKHRYHYITQRKEAGFKYCGPGKKVGTIQYRDNANSKEPSKTESVFATSKAHGIPFEVNTGEDNSNFREYLYYLLGFNKLQPGDKMAGMHGNKGVVSRVLKDSEALQLKNGMTIEFELNPCGVPSRMNLGQILECHLSLVAKVLSLKIISPPFNGASSEDIEYLMNYAWELANTPTIGDNVTKTYNKGAFDAVCAKYNKLPQSVHNYVWQHIVDVIDWRDVFDKHGSAIVYDPQTDSFLPTPVTIGFPTFNKLMQEADEKLNVRSGALQESYSKTSSQPLKGDSSAKGQSMAEMELMALTALGANNFIDEIINEKSDNSGRRINKLFEKLKFPDKVPDASAKSRAVENLIYELEACGIMLDVPKDIADVSMSASNSKYTIDIHKYINDKLSPYTMNTKRTLDTNSDFESIED